METKYIKHFKKWSAFTTINGLDVHEFGYTESASKQNLIDRISKSEFLQEGIKLPKL